MVAGATSGKDPQRFHGPQTQRKWAHSPGICSQNVKPQRNEGLRMCQYQVKFAELIWTNAFNTNALPGTNSGFCKHVLLTIHTQFLFSSLIHLSIHLFLCEAIHAHVHKTKGYHPYSVPDSKNMEIDKRLFTHSFHKSLLRTYYRPGTLFGIRNPVVKE